MLSRSPATVSYTVATPDPHTHLFLITAHIPVPEGADHVELKIPAWSPGSYMIREYCRHIQRVSATSGGEALAVRKVDKATWRVSCAGASTIEARYEVFGHEVSIRMNHLDDSHGYINAPSLYLYPEGQLAAPVEVTFKIPTGWEVFTGMDVADAAARRFSAPDFDTLYDMPVELGPHAPIVFEAAGKPHRVVIWGRSNVEPERLIADFTRIIETQASMFGGELPYEHYTFIIHLKPDGFGGLEHQNSTVLLTDPHSFSEGAPGTSFEGGLPDSVYREFLRLVSHELFHVWNVKRIRPSVLGPFDYQQENYTRELWTVEGITSYYDTLFMVRAGLMTPEAYFKEIATNEIRRLEGIPGRAVQSLEDASFDAWIKLYRPDEHTVNSTVSYYLKGSLMTWLLDLWLRAKTDGARSLDDVMRALWAHYQATGEGYDEGSFGGWIAQATDVPREEVEAFLEVYMRLPGPVDFDAPLARVGLALGRQVGKKATPWLGCQTAAEGDRVMVRAVLDGSPAQRAGVYAGDELVALDNLRLTPDSLPKLLRRYAPGMTVDVHLFRRGELRARAVTLGEPRPETYTLAVHPEATDAQRAQLSAWLGQPLDA